MDTILLQLCLLLTPLALSSALDGGHQYKEVSFFQSKVTYSAHPKSPYGASAEFKPKLTPQLDLTSKRPVKRDRQPSNVFLLRSTKPETAKASGELRSVIKVMHESKTKMTTKTPDIQDLPFPTLLHFLDPKRSTEFYDLKNLVLIANRPLVKKSFTSKTIHIFTKQSKLKRRKHALFQRYRRSLPQDYLFATSTGGKRKVLYVDKGVEIENKKTYNLCPEPCNCVYDTDSTVILVDCSNKELKEIPTLPTTSKKVYLQNNKINTIPCHSFASLTSLIELDLSHNEIDDFSNCSFASLLSLQYLSLSNCSLNTLPQGIFISLRSLLKLDLSINNINNIDGQLFLNLAQLTNLNLYRNRLPRIRNGSFQGLSKLRFLSLQRNLLKYIPNTFELLAFEGLPSLETLHIQGNQNKLPEKFTYPDQALSRLPSLQQLRLDGYPRPLGPGFAPLTNLTLLDFSTDKEKPNVESFCYMADEIPSDFFANLVIRQSLSLNMSSCTIRKIPSELFKYLSNIYSLDLSFNPYLGIDGFEMGSKGLQNSSLTELYLSDIVISYTQFVLIKNTTFIHLSNTKLKILILDNCQIFKITPGAVSFLPKTMEYISLQRNRIQYADFVRGMFRFINLKTFKISTQLHYKKGEVPVITTSSSLFTDISAFNYTKRNMHNGKGSNLNKDQKLRSEAFAATEEPMNFVEQETKSDLEKSMNLSYLLISDEGDAFKAGEHDGDDAFQAGEHDGDDAFQAGEHDGDDAFQAGEHDGDDAFQAGEHDGDDAFQAGEHDGDDAFQAGEHDGDDAFQAGEHDGDDAFQAGEHDGDDEFCGYLPTQSRSPRLTFTPFPLPLKLEFFYASDINTKYNIPRLQVMNNKVLKYLDYSKNGAKCFGGPITGVPSLQHLDLSQNGCLRMNPFMFSDMPSLTTLLLHHNVLGQSLSDDVNGITFSALYNLTTLDLSVNSIKDLSEQAFTQNPHLRILNLSNNELSHFRPDLSSITRLEILDLSVNTLEDLSDITCSQFIDMRARNANFTVRIKGNRFLCNCGNFRLLRLLIEQAEIFYDARNFQCRLTNGSLLDYGGLAEFVPELAMKCIAETTFTIVSIIFFTMTAMMVIASVYYYKRWQWKYLYYLGKSRLHIGSTYVTYRSVAHTFVTYDQVRVCFEIRKCNRRSLSK